MAIRQWQAAEHDTLRRLTIDGRSLKSQYPALQLRRRRGKKLTNGSSHTGR